MLCKNIFVTNTYTFILAMLLAVWYFCIVIQGKFSELVELLPTNCYSTICKLRKMVNFADVDEKMSSKLSEHDDASVINDQLLSYIVDKCAGNVVLLWDVLEEVVSTSKKKQLRIGMKVLCNTYVCTYTYI